MTIEQSDIDAIGRMFEPYLQPGESLYRTDDLVRVVNRALSDNSADRPGAEIKEGDIDFFVQLAATKAKIAEFGAKAASVDLCSGIDSKENQLNIRRLLGLDT